jgi:ABC-type lipoprotein export system ATPase subunit
MLQLENISKTFRIPPAPSLTVLDKIDFTFEDKKAYAICGQSGSGKSTLLYLLAGLDKPNEGKVLWKNENIFEWSRNQIAEWRNQTLGFIFQSFHLLPELTVEENVKLPLMIGKSPKALSPQDVLKRVGLQDRMHHYPHELSGGEQQRVAIARALVNNPEVILADEPTGNLDSHTAEQIFSLLMETCADFDKTLVLVTHNEELAKKIPHRYHLIEKKLYLDSLAVVG